MQTVKLCNVYKTIKGNPILEDVSMELQSGYIYGVYGRNASGKTMLFRAISGLITIDSGTINVFGENIGQDVSFPSSLGLIIENVGLWKQLTGYENLKLLADIKRIIGRSEIEHAMRRVGLDPDDKRRYSAYSLGMRQKLAIAQAFMESPNLLILDEPTNSLDQQSVDGFYQILLEEKQRGAICMISSHQKEDIIKLCDKVFVMDSGRCQLLEDKEELL